MFTFGGLEIGYVFERGDLYPWTDSFVERSKIGAEASPLRYVVLLYTGDLVVVLISGNPVLSTPRNVGSDVDGNI